MMNLDKNTTSLIITSVIVIAVAYALSFLIRNWTTIKATSWEYFETPTPETTSFDVVKYPIIPLPDAARMAVYGDQRGCNWAPSDFAQTEIQNEKEEGYPDDYPEAYDGSCMYASVTTEFEVQPATIATVVTPNNESVPVAVIPEGTTPAVVSTANGNTIVSVKQPEAAIATDALAAVPTPASEQKQIAVPIPAEIQQVVAAPVTTPVAESAVPAPKLENKPLKPQKHLI